MKHHKSNLIFGSKPVTRTKFKREKDVLVYNDETYLIYKKDADEESDRTQVSLDLIEIGVAGLEHFKQKAKKEIWNELITALRNRINTYMID